MQPTQRQLARLDLTLLASVDNAGPQVILEGDVGGGLAGTACEGVLAVPVVKH